MFNQINSCSSRFQQQFNYIEAQPPQPINYNLSNQMNPQFSTCQNEFQTNQLHSCFEPEDGKTRFPETGLEESEVVDELLQILAECLKKADVRTQEVLLRKFFFEIEKEISLERFLVERIKHSKINFLSESLEKIPGCSGDSERIFGAETGMEISTREINASSSLSEGETSEKLERFKVKTIQVGEIVKEEAR